MGLFDKKYCDICGEKIGLFGNRKLEDGNLCKDCAAKLSPWFSERRSSTIAEIKEQLAYREANKEKVAAFEPVTTLGYGTKVMVDEGKGLFLITSASNWREANPDVLALTDVTGCKLEDRPGGLARIVKVISAIGVNMEYMYAFLTKSDSAYLVIRVEDNDAVEAALRSRGIPLLQEDDVTAL